LFRFVYRMIPETEQYGGRPAITVDQASRAELAGRFEAFLRKDTFRFLLAADAHHGVYIDPARRRAGVSKQLLSELMEWESVAAPMIAILIYAAAFR
jgi:GNAT superfamily N-acetyltransferase